MVNVKKGDLVRMEYTGTISSSGTVFDTTDESVARKAGIYDASSMYGPKIAVFGNRMIIRGLEEAIAKAELGKTEQFSIDPQHAFGEKQKSLVRMMPYREFAKQGVEPVSGMTLGLDGVPARVKSVTSGRVVVDFNHPLAGEAVTYTLKVNEVISEDGKKLEAMLPMLEVKGKVSQQGGGFLVEFEKGQPSEKVEAAKRALLSVVPGAAFSVA